MFKVNVKREENTTTYYCYDAEEVVQTQLVGLKSILAINNDVEKIVKIIPNETGAIYIIKNPTPVIIKEDVFEEYLNNLRKALNSPFINELDRIGTIPFTKITKEDYKMLKALSEYQQKDSEETKEKDEINNDIKTGWQLVRKYNPNYGYRTY